MNTSNSVADLERALSAAQREVQRLRAALAAAASKQEAGQARPASQPAECGSGPERPTGLHGVVEEPTLLDALGSAWAGASLEAIPLAVWVLGFSALRPRIEELRRVGVTSFAEYFQKHPEETQALAARVKVLGYNRHAWRLLKGDAPGELIGHLPTYLREESWPALGTILAGMAEGAATLEVELPLWTLSGQKRYVLWRQAADAAGSSPWDEVSVALVDITARKQAELALRQSEERFRRLVESAHHVTYCYSLQPEPRLEYISPSAAGMTGYPLEEHYQNAGLAWASWMHPEDRAALEKALVLGGNFYRPIELRLTHRNGRTIWTEQIHVPVYDDGGELVGLDGIALDVTERKEAEAALRASEQRYRSLLETLQEGIWVVDALGHTTFVNPRMAEMLGYRTEEMLGRPVAAFLEAKGPGAGNPLESRQHGGGAFELELVRKDGSKVATLVRTSPLYDSRGNYTGTLAGVADITQRRRQEEQLHHMQVQLAHASRLATLGEMVAGLAHEVSQPLFSILNYSTACGNLLSQGRADVELLAQWNREIAAEAARAGEILRRLRTFARRAEPERALADLHEVIEEAIALVAAEARSRGIHIEKRLPNRALLAHFDRVEIQQVLVNLLRNAFEALETVAAEGRQVVIETAAEGPWARVAVADNGPGVPSSLVSQIFEPFMTTKPEGMGMGLAISRTLIEAHGGTLAYTPAEGGGAKFHFCLPLASAR